MVASRERLLGPTHPEVALALIDLANLLLTSGKYAAAKPIYERALDIQSQALGAGHPDVAKALHNLALVNHRMGDFDTARRLFERSLAIKEEDFGLDHLEVAWTLNALAALLEDAGDYAGARTRYERALAIRMTALGPDHLYVALSLNNLGYLLRTMGDYGEAQALFQRALGIEEKILGAEDPDVAMTRYNLAEVFRLTGAFEQARVLHEQALRTREKTLGPNRAAQAESLHALGSVLLETGDLEASRTLHERAVEIWMVALGADHPQYAIGLSGLASVLARTGRWRESKDLFDRALSIQEKALGSDHPDLAQNLVRLGEVLVHEGETDRALACFLRAEEIGRGHLRLAVTALSEREALRYASVRPSGLDPALSLAVSGRLPDPPSEVFDMVIRSRVLVLDEMASRRHIVAATGGERAKRPLEALTRASRRLASLKIRGPEGHAADQYLRSISLAQKEREDAERGLAKESAAFRRNLVKVQAGVRDVTAALPSRSALVGYVLFRDGGSDAASPAYLALVLRGGAKRPVLVRLGEAAKIDDLVAVWRGRIAGWRPGGPLPALEADPAARAAGESLRRRVWDPLAGLLRGTARVFIVPDGALHFVDFSALPIGEAGYVLDEDPLIHYLSSERDLLRQPSQEGRGWGLLALGGPDFDLSRSAVLPSLAGRRGEGSEGSAWSRGLSYGCSDWRSLRFSALPAAGQEIEEIAALWSDAVSGSTAAGGAQPPLSPETAPAVIRLSGPDATEAAFKRDSAGRRTLHLATHGFFLDALCPQASPLSRGVGGLRA